MQLEIFDPWQSRGRSSEKSMESWKKKYTKFISIHTNPISLGVFISKTTTAAAEETVEGDSGGSLPHDRHSLLETPG